MSGDEVIDAELVDLDELNPAVVDGEVLSSSTEAPAGLDSTPAKGDPLLPMVLAGLLLMLYLGGMLTINWVTS